MQGEGGSGSDRRLQGRGFAGAPGERTARVLAGYRRTASDRGRGQARDRSGPAAVLATCHERRQTGRGRESIRVARERGVGGRTHGPPPGAPGPPPAADRSGALGAPFGAAAGSAAAPSAVPAIGRRLRHRGAGTPATRTMSESADSLDHRVIDIPITGPLLSIAMSVIAQAIADRQSEIDRLEAEIKALSDVEQLLGTSAAPPPPRSRRSPSPPKAAAAAAESKPETKPSRKRREMSAAEKKAVSERMTAYWARKKAGKK